MFAFLIKKWFFDLWDNFLPAILVNLGFIVVLSVPILLSPAASSISILFGLGALGAGILLVSVYLGGVFAAASSFTDYKAISFSEFRDGIRRSLQIALIFGAIVIGHIALLSVAVPFYASIGNWIGLFALALIFWVSLTWFLASGYVFPVRMRLSKEPKPILKKAFILLLDNVTFSLAVAVGAVAIACLSVFTAFLLPGISGIAIWYEAAVKLRLYKYDHLETHPEDRHAIPWDELLYEDRERVGKRTLRGMIFPWKE